MEELLLAIFFVLFIGRLALRFILQQLNMKNLRVHGKEIPAVFQGAIDETTLNKMLDYTDDQSHLESREKLVSDIIELAIVFFLLPLLVESISESGWHIIGQAMFFFAVLAAVSALAGLPFDLYHTFVLERQYGFSTITWKLWVADLIKSVIISAVLLALMVSVLMAFITWLPKSWWFWGWVFFTLFQIMLMWLYPVFIAPLFNKFEPLKDDVLREKINVMLSRAGLAAKGLYQVDEGKRSRHTNAYFTGIGKTKRIVLFDTLLASHTHEEIISVLAHEIGHWKKKHILKQLTFMTAASLILIYLIYLVVSWPPLFGAFRMNQTPVYAGLFLASLYLTSAGFFLSPLGTAITRRFEREADRMAFDLTGTAQPMISALKRLASDNLSNLHPHPWYVRFFYSHPPLTERIAYLQAMDYKIDKP
jgi:STE24 endopeptidase